MWKLLIAVAFIAASAASGATAQVYPARPVTMVVPFAAGGSSDTIGRIMADGMRGPLGQTVVIENVGGASGNIGVGRVARAARRSPPEFAAIDCSRLTPPLPRGGAQRYRGPHPEASPEV